jgi:hypothetical protein
MRRVSAVTVVSLLVLGAIGGCALEGDDLASEEELTFEEFEALTYQEPDTGIYIVNGDEAVESIDKLRAIYEEWRVQESLPDGIGSTRQGLTINRVGGVDDRLTESRSHDITYCVSQSSFGSRYNTVVTAMANAAAAWEAAGDLEYVHLSQFDGNCTASQSGVFFDVRQTSQTSFLARAFFPSYGRSSRNILISTSAFGNISPWTMTGILRHELGHIGGFRHEHIRAPGNPCPESGSSRAVTAYDAASVMHYPQCNGTQNGDLVLTNLDREGTAAIYGP